MNQEITKKYCTKCNTEYPRTPEYFYHYYNPQRDGKRNEGKVWVHPYCKRCLNEINKERKNRNYVHKLKLQRPVDIIQERLDAIEETLDDDLDLIDPLHIPALPNQYSNDEQRQDVFMAMNAMGWKFKDGIWFKNNVAGKTAVHKLKDGTWHLGRKKRNNKDDIPKEVYKPSVNAEYQREWRKKNLEKMRTYHRDYYHNHKK